MNESCHIWMNRIEYEWVMSHMNELFRICMSQVTSKCVMSHMAEPCPAKTNHVMSYMNESCHIWMSHDTHMNESYHIWMSHVTHKWVMVHMNASCHITGRRAANQHGPVSSLMNESRHIRKCHDSYECAMSHIIGGRAASQHRPVCFQVEGPDFTAPILE